MSIAPVIFGFTGTSLTSEEVDFFSRLQPYGYILFSRNCDNAEQISSLTRNLREISGRGEKLPILIDQEGGRVARLKPPHFPEFPPASYFADMARSDIEAARKATYKNAKKIAELLKSLGITVNCAPLADIPIKGSNNVIGDRAFGDTPQQVSILAREMARGLMDGGVVPVLKHIPGHGRAFADSHLELPIVGASLGELWKTDFVPFKALNDLPMAMTAHILYTAIDDKNLATVSKSAISLIRDVIGFSGLLMSDDLSMKAMQGDYRQRAEQTLSAGCDIVLHCNGNMAEMQQVALGLAKPSEESLARMQRAVEILG